MNFRLRHGGSLFFNDGSLFRLARQQHFSGMHNRTTLARSLRRDAGNRRRQRVGSVEAVGSSRWLVHWPMSGIQLQCTTKQWSARSFGPEVSGPWSTLRHAMLDETALISGIGPRLSRFREGAAVVQVVPRLCSLSRKRLGSQLLAWEFDSRAHSPWCCRRIAASDLACSVRTPLFAEKTNLTND
jgi:hypothetical protein